MVYFANKFPCDQASGPKHAQLASTCTVSAYASYIARNYFRSLRAHRMDNFCPIARIGRKFRTSPSFGKTTNVTRWRCAAPTLNIQTGLRLLRFVVNKITTILKKPYRAAIWAQAMFGPSIGPHKISARSGQQSEGNKITTNGNKITTTKIYRCPTGLPFWLRAYLGMLYFTHKFPCEWASKLDQ